MKDYFFSGGEYIRVTRGETGPGSVDGPPRPISVWGWGDFGAAKGRGIDAALYSGPKCYFFSGQQYIRVTRGETGPGSVDKGYPAPISNWGWGSFGANGIDAALYSSLPPQISVTILQGAFALTGAGFVPWTTVQVTTEFFGIFGGPYPFTVASDGTFYSVIPIDYLEPNGVLGVEAEDNDSYQTAGTTAVVPSTY